MIFGRRYCGGGGCASDCCKPCHEPTTARFRAFRQDQLAFEPEVAESRHHGHYPISGNGPRLTPARPIQRITNGINVSQEEEEQIGPERTSVHTAGSREHMMVVGAEDADIDEGQRSRVGDKLMLPQEPKITLPSRL